MDTIDIKLSKEQEIEVKKYAEMLDISIEEFIIKAIELYIMKKEVIFLCPKCGSREKTNGKDIILRGDLLCHVEKKEYIFKIFIYRKCDNCIDKDDND